MENITLKQIGMFVGGLIVTAITVVVIVYFAGVAWRKSQEQKVIIGG